MILYHKMGNRKLHKRKRLENLKKARAKRCGQPVLPKDYTPIEREPSPIQNPSDDVPEVNDRPNYYESSDSYSSSNNQSGDDYEEVQSILLISLNSLRAIIRHMICKGCKGQHGDMWPTVTNLRGFKVEITVSCKCGHSFVHEIFDQLDVNKAVIRCLISNGISFEAFQRFLIVMGFTYWSEQRNSYLSVNLSKPIFDSQLENQAIIDAADSSEKKFLMRSARQSSVTVSFDGTYKTQGFNSRSCFGAFLDGKKVIASDVVKKEMRPTFKGVCYGIMKSISSNAMECFMAEELLKRINPIIGNKISNIDTDGDARIPKVIPKIQWTAEDSERINPITRKPFCNPDNIGTSIWNDGKCPKLRQDKVRAIVKIIYSKSEF